LKPLTTAVIGAGPAGMLFCAIGKLLFGERPWRLHLYDKRDVYVRTHRLRMDREPYLAIQRDVNDERFDALVAFLDEHDFAPEVNALEKELAGILDSLGIKKEKLELGPVTLEQLRERLKPEGEFTIVAADSVHSTVRELVRGDVEPIKHTHERVARVRVVGEALPKSLGVVNQYRLAKVLGSVVDYRLNRNGFAEVDLFLAENEHAIAREFNATPAAPVAIESKQIRAPFFRGVVQHLESNGRKVLLQSTFSLEHSLMPRLSFEAAGARVFLLGDAGISLPFFRGMACLARCAHSLARVHRDGEWERYDREAAEIKSSEVKVVRSRARLVRFLREFVRMSAMLPFPIQSWWLSSVDREYRAGRASIGFFVNLAIAIAGLAPLFTRSWWLALIVEAAGGVAYHAVVDREKSRATRRIWESQIFAAALWGAFVAWRTRSLLPLTWWWLMGLSFVVGLYAFENVVSSWFQRAILRD
jgi:hypothetical protein